MILKKIFGYGRMRKDNRRIDLSIGNNLSLGRYHQTLSFPLTLLSVAWKYWSNTTVSMKLNVNDKSFKYSFEYNISNYLESDT